MNRHTIFAIIAVLFFILGVMPLGAQNSPAGGLASGNVMNRDVDTYMMVNFAPFLNYDRFFTFFQTSMYSGTLGASGLPGFQAGLSTKTLGGFMNFYVNTSAFNLDIDNMQTTTAAGALENSDKSGRFNLQFDTIYGQADLGTFKLGLLFTDVGKNETYTETSLTNNTRTTTQYGFFTPSLAYGRNFVHDDFSMLLASATLRFRFPFDFGRTVTNQTSGGVTTTTTTAPALLTPSVPFNASMRLEVEPQIWYFFKPKLEPMVVISHIYLVNTFIKMFYPEETSTIERAGLSNGYARREHSYVGNTLFGYYNRLYVITSRFSLAWRVNASVGFYLDDKGYTYEKPLGGSAETVTRVNDQELYLTATVAPRLAFSYQLIPATLSLNGAVVLNQLGPLNATGWQFYRNKRTDDGSGLVTTQNRHIFNGINAVFNLGAAWNLNPYLVLEGGIEINTAGPSGPLDNVSLGVVYKR